MTKFPQNNITKFEQVDFVHNMTPLQLKNIILNLWLGLDQIANEYENNTPNITQTIDELKDALRNGTKWKVKKSIDRFKHFKTGECFLQ